MPEKTFEEAMLRARAAMDKRLSEIHSGMGIQYNIVLPLTREQAERVIRLWEDRQGA